MNTSPDGIDPRQFRSVLGRFASGVTIVTTERDGQPHGMTANAFVSVSLNPPLILVSVDHRTHMHQLLPMNGRYGVSILAEDQQTLSDRFAGRQTGGVEVRFTYKHNMPVVEGAMAYLVARVVDAHLAGDHTLYIGHIEYLEWRDGQPLLFYAGQYRRLDRVRLTPPQWPEDEMALFSFGNY